MTHLRLKPEPVAWRYEVATNRIWEDGKPTGWGGWEWWLTEREPCVPEGSIRNLTPLYAAPAQPEAMPGREELTTEELTKLSDDVDNNRHLNGRQREYLLALLSSAKEAHPNTEQVIAELCEALENIASNGAPWSEDGHAFCVDTARDALAKHKARGAAG